jgi:hypothetical protein
MDPFEGEVFDPASLHKYEYARLNPVSFNDPTGLIFSGHPLVEVQMVAELQGQLRKDEAAQNYVRYRAVRRSLCETSFVMWKYAMHHVVLVFMGNNRVRGTTVELPLEAHVGFHGLLRNMLVFAGLPAPDREEYRKLLENPMSRRVAMQILLRAARVFDKQCADKIGIRLEAEIKKELRRTGNFDF